MRFKYWFGRGIVCAIILFLLVDMGNAQNGKLTFEDVMKWEDIEDPAISANGEWLVYSVWPDRGDGEVKVRHVEDGTIHTIELGDNPKITRDGNWAGAYVKPKLKDQLEAEKDEPKQGAAFINTADGSMIRKDNVQSFTFSHDGEWVAIRHHANEQVQDKKSENKFLGSELVLRNLNSGDEQRIPFVRSARFDSASTQLVYSVADTTGEENGVYYFDLTNSASHQQKITGQKNGLYANLSWDDKNNRLAFTEAVMDSSYETGDANIHVWNGPEKELKLIIDSSSVEDEWALRTNNSLEWTDDGERLFFGVMPRGMTEAGQNQEGAKDSIDIYDQEQILSEKEMDVWHTEDPRIKTHEKETWNRRKNKIYRAVYHFDDEDWIQLADQEVPDVMVSQNSQYALGRSNEPYLKERTWDGTYRDYYSVDLKTGERKKIVDRSRFGATLSPEGQYIAYYNDENWHLYDIEAEATKTITSEIETPFYNEDHDRPYETPGYSIAGWTTGDSDILIYDKYDVWKFSTESGEAVNLTEDGRDREVSYRIIHTDREREALQEDEELLVRGYYDKKKYYGFYNLKLDEPGTEEKLESEHKYDFITKAEDADRIIFSRESYDEYPNLWVSDGLEFEDTDRVTDLHLDLHDKYNWGTAELVEWQSMDDGRSIQGTVIKPDNYEEGKQYPVLVYYYRFYSHRGYEFNNITNDDRPTLPQWVSDDYIVFLPDIYFETGTPGFSATKSLVPGVQKLIDMGIAHPDKIGLHGHSWSGYQTTFMITQTDIFGAAIAGAPVSNMTSAYSGIRWGTGLARQFQYEKTQSRIGGSLWEYPERYIENSPVFYADRINTPLLMMFGDADTAVPWYQGIEMYLAMRRLDKDAVFLQYHDEPHHLMEYANRLDYAIKMKEYFDHYLRDKEAPDWIEEGVPFQGK